MIILRNKNYSFFGNLFKKKNQIERKQVSEVDKQRLTNLLKTNPRQYLIEVYNLDTVTKRLGELERTYGIKLPQDIYKYVEVIKSFAGPLKKWATRFPNFDPLLREDGIINNFNIDLENKNGKIESFKRDLEESGDIFLLDSMLDDVIAYNINNKVWSSQRSYHKEEARTLKEILLSCVKDAIDEDEVYAMDAGYDENGEVPAFELRKLWYQHLKSKL